MAATLLIREKNGAGETATDKTSGTIRFKNADNATVDIANPMVKPSSGSDWSFEKWCRVNISGTFTTITNLGVYMDGANGWTGTNLWVKTQTVYSTPAEATTSTPFTNFFAYTSGGKLTLHVTASGTITGTGDQGLYWIMAAEVQTTATSGTLAAEVMSVSWDEI